MPGARTRAAKPPEGIAAPAAAKNRRIAPSNVVPPAIAEAPARKPPARRAPARRTVQEQPPAIDAALGAPERAPRKAAAKLPPARRAARKTEAGARAPVQTTINPNYAWPFADAERV